MKIVTLGEIMIRLQPYDHLRFVQTDTLRRELTDHVRKIIAEKNVLLQLYPDYFATAQQEMKL